MMIDKIIAAFAMLLIFLGIVGITVYMPVSLYTEKQCLAKGYPEFKVDVALNRYCMNLDGTVTVRVERAGK